MAANVSFSPYAMTVGKGLFTVQADGLRQGTAFPDPATRYALRTTILAADETLPMWGGVGIYMNVPTAVQASPQLGPISGRALSMNHATKPLAGFSVFDQAYGMVITPQSNVPQIGSGGQVMAYALGSRARIAVNCDPALVALQGGPIKPLVAWDFVQQKLVPYNAAALTVSSGTYDNVTGITTLTMSAAINFGPGDSFVLSALTGTGAFASLNGSRISVTPTAGTTVTFVAPAGLGATTITGGTLTPSSGVGVASALPVAVLNVRTTNCMTVDGADPITGLYNYNFDGCCAVIQI
jgi:hypothetical protein